jgi:hypothetical protein
VDEKCSYQRLDQEQLILQLLQLEPEILAVEYIRFKLPRFSHSYLICDGTQKIPEDSNVMIKKAVPFQAWSGPDVSRNLRLTDYMTSQDGGEVSASRTGRLYPRKYSWC